MPIMRRLRFTSSSLEALQEASESHLVDMFSGGVKVHANAKRTTLFARDLQLVRALRNPTELTPIGAPTAKIPPAPADPEPESLVLFGYFAAKVLGVAHGNHWHLLADGYGAWFLVEMLGFVLLPC